MAASNQTGGHIIGSLSTYTLCAAFAHGLATYTPSPLDGEPGTLTIAGKAFAAGLDKFGVPVLDIASGAALKETLRKNGWA